MDGVYLPRTRQQAKIWQFQVQNEVSASIRQLTFEIYVGWYKISATWKFTTIISILEQLQEICLKIAWKYNEKVDFTRQNDNQLSQAIYEVSS